MKNVFFITLVLSVFLSCKNDKKSENTEQTTEIENSVKQADSIAILKGNFVYYDGAAVLQTNSEIYGVFVTDKMLELNKQAEKYKKTPTDMVVVDIKGKVSKIKDDKILWENKVEILEIINVTQPNTGNNNTIKLGDE